MFQLETSETVRVMGVGRKSSILPFGRGKVAVGRKTLQLTLQVREGIVQGLWWACMPSVTQTTSWWVVVGKRTLQLTFQVSGGLWRAQMPSSSRFELKRGWW